MVVIHVVIIIVFSLLWSWWCMADAVRLVVSVFVLLLALCCALVCSVYGVVCNVYWCMAGSLKVVQFIMSCWPGLSSHLSACHLPNGRPSITWTNTQTDTQSHTHTHIYPTVKELAQFPKRNIKNTIHLWIHSLWQVNCYHRGMVCFLEPTDSESSYAHCSIKNEHSS